MLLLFYRRKKGRHFGQNSSILIISLKRYNYDKLQNCVNVLRFDLAFNVNL